MDFDFDELGDDELSGGLDFDDSSDQARGQRFRNMHLNSPLDTSYIPSLEEFRKRNPKLRHFAHTVGPQVMVAKVAQWAMAGAYPTRVDYSTADEKVRLELYTACRFLEGPMEMTKIRHSELTQSLIGLGADLERVSLKTAKHEAGEVASYLAGLSLKVSSDYWECSLGLDSSILSHDMFLMMKDMILARGRILEALEITNALNPKLEFGPDYLASVWSWGDQIIAQIGTPAYDLIKSFESLVVGRLAYVTTRSEDVAGGPEFQESMRKGFAQDANERGVPHAVTIFQLIDEISDPDSLNELSGIYKTWGHPCVDVPAGIAANRKVAEAIKPPSDPATVNKMTLLFRRLFMTEYFRKHRIHPCCSVDKMPEGNQVREAVLGGVAVPSSVPDEEYQGLEFKRTFDSDYVSSLDIVHDKALGPTLSELKECIKTHRKNDIMSRRTLLHYLSQDHPQLSEVLRELDDKGIDKEYLTLGVTPKERELKTKARLFSLIPMTLKFYFGGTEKLIADHILPYFPQITMKDDLRDLTEKVLGMTDEGVDGSIASIALHIDFEKWNMNFRDDMARPVFTEIDRLFGFKQLISMTHSVFESIQYHCHDGKHWPELDATGGIIQGPLAWRGQYGGVEGLRQKGWTILTILIILSATTGSPAKFQLTGQGDNQVLCAKYYLPKTGGLEAQDHDVVEAIKLDFEDWKTRLYGVAQEVGMPIKPSESWSSSTLYSYGKNTYYHGRPLEAKLKRLSRCFPTTNDLHPSLYSSIVSIGANGQSAAYQSSSPIVAYWVSTRQIQLSFTLHFESHPGAEGGRLPLGTLSYFGHRLIQETPTELIRDMMYGSSVVGGYPITHLYSYFSLGGPDHLTEYLSWFDEVHKFASPTIASALVRWCSPVTNPKSPDFTMLFQDPGSGNFLSGTIASNLVKRVVKKWFQSGVVRNRTVLSLLKVQELEDSHLISALQAMTPLNPLIGSYLVSVTPAEFAREFVGRFDNASSIRILATSGEVSFSSRMSKLESDYFLSSWTQLSTARNEPLPKCPTKRAQYLRCKSWGRDDIVGVTSPAFFGLLQLSQCSHSDLILTMSETRASYLFRSRGLKQPYTGSRGEKVVQQHNDYTSVDPEKIVKRVMRAIRVMGATLDEDDPIMSWLHRVWSSVTDYPYESFGGAKDSEKISQAPIMRQMLTTGGSLSHHFTISTHTWLVPSFDSALLKGTSLSKNVHMPTITLTLNALLATAASLGVVLRPRYDMEVKCHECAVPCAQDTGGPAALLAVPTPPMEGVEGIWVPRDKLSKTIVHNRLAFHGISVRPPTSRLDLLSWVGWELASVLLGRATRRRSNLLLDWVTKEELGQSILSWCGALTFGTHSLQSREEWYSYQDWVEDLQRRMLRVERARYLSLYDALLESRGFWDSPTSMNRIVTNPLDRDSSADELRILISESTVVSLPIVKQSGWVDSVTAYVSFSCWTRSGKIRLGSGCVMRRAQEVERYCLDNHLIVGSGTLSVPATTVPENLKKPAEDVLRLILRHSFLGPILPIVLDMPAPREVVVIASGERGLAVRWMDEIDVDCTYVPVREEPFVSSRLDAVDLTNTSRELNLSAFRKLMSTLEAVLLQSTYQFYGWGASHLASMAHQEGYQVACCWETYNTGGAAPPYLLDKCPYPLPAPWVQGVGTVFVLPNDFSNSYSMHIAQGLISIAPLTSVLLVPWRLSVQTGKFLTFVRRSFQRFRVLACVRDEPSSCYCIVLEGARLLSTPLRDVLVVPRLYPDWQSALRGGGVLDQKNRPSGSMELLWSYTGHVESAPASELWEHFLANALDGVDLASHYPEARRKRYRGPESLPLNLRDLSVCGLAVADACGLLLPPSSFLGVAFVQDKARLTVSAKTGVLSYPLGDQLKSDILYGRILAAARSVIAKDSLEDRPYAPGSPSYCPSSPVVVGSDDEWS